MGWLKDQWPAIQLYYLVFVLGGLIVYLIWVYAAQEPVYTCIDTRSNLTIPCPIQAGGTPNFSHLPGAKMDQFLMEKNISFGDFS